MNRDITISLRRRDDFNRNSISLWRHVSAISLRHDAVHHATKEVRSMLSQADQSALDAYEAQITQLEGAAGQQGGAADSYNQQLDSWLDEIKKQFGADDGVDSGNDSTTPASGNASGGSTAPAGQGSDAGSGSSSTNDSQSSFDQNLSQLQSILAQKGASPAEQDNAMLGAQEAQESNGKYGDEPMTLLLKAAQQDGYHGVQIVMTAFEDAESQDLNALQFASAGLGALKMQQIGGDGASDAYLEALAGNGGLDGANEVLSSAQNVQAQGGDSNDVADTAWVASLDSQQQGLAAAHDKAGAPGGDTMSTEFVSGSQGGGGASTAATPPAISIDIAPGVVTMHLNDLKQKYDQLLDDLQSGAGQDKIQTDAASVVELASTTDDSGFQDVGLAQAAMLAGADFDSDPSKMIDVLKAVNPDDSNAHMPIAGLSPLNQSYLKLALSIGENDDGNTIKQNALDLGNMGVANGHPELVGITTNIGVSVDKNTFDQQQSLIALMQAPIGEADPAANGSGDAPAADTSPPPQPAPDSEMQADQTLQDDLTNNADPNTIITDALTLVASARDKGDLGTAQAALHIGQAAQAGSLDQSSGLAELQNAAPGSDAAKMPKALQWAPSGTGA